MYECTSYLGIDLMNNPFWSNIVKLCSKFTQEICILRRVKHKVSVVIGYLVSYNYTATH